MLLAELAEHFLQQVELDVHLVEAERAEILLEGVHVLEERFGGDFDGGFVGIDFRAWCGGEGEPV